MGKLNRRNHLTVDSNINCLKTHRSYTAYFSFEMILCYLIIIFEF